MQVNHSHVIRLIFATYFMKNRVNREKGTRPPTEEI